MPKRPKKSKPAAPGTHEQPEERSDRSDTRTLTDAAGATDGLGVEERGAFAVARCERCGWQGAARRSRERARKDLEHHLADKPKHADQVTLTEVGG